jgi:glycerol-3-phosphate dehydrogenase
MRLRPPSDADALIPDGTVSIFGTSSVTIDSPDNCYPTVAEVDHIIRQGAELLPILEKTRFIRAFAGVRPLIGLPGADDRAISRDMALIDHRADGLENFISITGGKLTTYRLMAEKTADIVCQRLGNSNPCLTRSMPLPSHLICRRSEKVSSPQQSWSSDDSDDSIMNKLTTGEGLVDFKAFWQHRWKGRRPILWGPQLQQAELAEALHCGLFGLELHYPEDDRFEHHGL